MELISSQQLASYERLLGEIDTEFERSEQLKKDLLAAENTISCLKLCSLPSSKHVAFVNVKMFDSFHEILNLYESDLDGSKDFVKCADCKFALIEIILAKGVGAKLVELEWKLQITVHTDFSIVVKVLPLYDKHSIFEVVPIGNNIIDCRVDCCLFNENGWNTIELGSINVDISYHFDSYKESKINTETPFLNLAKLYAKSDHLPVQNPKVLQYEVKCRLKEKEIVNVLIRNSYHRLDVELFSEFLNQKKNVIDVNIGLNNQKLLVLYYRDRNVLKIKYRPGMLSKVKLLFLENFICDNSQFRKKLQKLKAQKPHFQNMDLTDLLAFYRQLRNLWH